MAADETQGGNAAWLHGFSDRLRLARVKSRVWITTGGKDHFVLVPRWRLIAAAFSRKDVRW